MNLDAERERLLGLAESEISVAYLNECFVYDAETGVLTWKERPQHHFVSPKVHKNFLARFPGKVAGYRKRSGYLAIYLAGGHRMAHRIIWAMVTGRWPEFIDHANRVKNDNRIENLRECSRSQNLHNAIQPPGASGLPGAMWHCNRWRTGLRIKGKFVKLGTFKTAEECSAAYVKAKNELCGEFSPFAAIAAERKGDR